MMDTPDLGWISADLNRPRTLAHLGEQLLAYKGWRVRQTLTPVPGAEAYMAVIVKSSDDPAKVGTTEEDAYLVTFVAEGDGKYGLISPITLVPK